MKLNKLLLSLKNKLFNPAINLDEYVKLRHKQGIPLDTIKEELLTDLNEGGRIFGKFRNAFKATYAGSIHRFKDIAELAEAGVDLKYRWVAVKLLKSPSCPDCLGRDRQLKTWEEWEKIGLPRTGKTRCKKNCKCVLIPEYK